MKIIIITVAVLLALAPSRCAEENEEVTAEDSIENGGYVAKDIEARKAMADWQVFITESDSAIFSAKVQISEATDRSETPKFKDNKKFRNDIFRADAKLVKLSDKLLRAKKLVPDVVMPPDEMTLQKMESFKKDFRADQAKLNEILVKLKNVK